MIFKTKSVNVSSEIEQNGDLKNYKLQQNLQQNTGRFENF